MRIIKHNKLISIIIPVYNVRKYIKQCITSVISQTYTNIEIILVDDESPDECGKICDEYAVKDDRIVVIHQKNKGVSQSRNNAIKISKGEYITFIDSDDFVEKNYIEELYKLVEKNNADIAMIGNDEIIDDKIRNNKEKIVGNFNSFEFLSEMLQEKKITAVCWGKMYKKNLFQDERKCFDDNIKIAEDLKMNMSIIEECSLISVDTSKKLYHYRINEDSVTKQNGNRELWKQEIKITNDIIKYCQKKYPQIEKYAIQRFIRVNITFIIKMLQDKDTHLNEDYELVKNNISKYQFEYILKTKASTKMKLKYIIIIKNFKLFSKLYYSLKNSK